MEVQHHKTTKSNKMDDQNKMQFCPVLDNDLPYDVTIQSNDGGTLNVHKVVLTGNSKFFEPQ